MDITWPQPKNDLEQFAADSIDNSVELIVPKDYAENDVSGKENDSCTGSSNTTEIDFEPTPKSKVSKARPNLRQSRFRVPKN